MRHGWQAEFLVLVRAMARLAQALALDALRLAARCMATEEPACALCLHRACAAGVGRRRRGAVLRGVARRGVGGRLLRRVWLWLWDVVGLRLRHIVRLRLRDVVWLRLAGVHAVIMRQDVVGLRSGTLLHHWWVHVVEHTTCVALEAVLPPNGRDFQQSLLLRPRSNRHRKLLRWHMLCLCRGRCLHQLLPALLQSVEGTRRLSV
mmetsp:Transcript_127121/g.353959  ORF Transcript_127121/g.353959 Transcript_127121/m.353959 type:complete len:205 (+) Transcript_127121:149-763(+)